MSIQPITQKEQNDNAVSSLPTRPGASTAFGGRGYTPAQIKNAFDRLPLLLCERYNDLVASLANGTLTEEVITSLDGKTLAGVLADIKSGEFASYLNTSLGDLESALHSRAECPTRVYDDSTDVHLVLSESHEYFFSNPLSSLSIEGGEDLTDDCRILLFFRAAESGIVAHYGEGITFLNDDCLNGVFTPIEGQCYQVCLRRISVFDGRVIGQVGRL